MTVLQKIQEIRKGKNISQKKMAELLHISQPGYQKIEQGVNVLSLDRFIEICRILEIDSYNLLLPPVNIEISEQINNTLIRGSLSFQDIQNNALAIRRNLAELIEKIRNKKTDLKEIVEDIEFLDNFLSIIMKESRIHGYNYITMETSIEKLD